MASSTRSKRSASSFLAPSLISNPSATTPTPSPSSSSSSSRTKRMRATTLSDDTNDDQATEAKQPATKRTTTNTSNKRVAKKKASAKSEWDGADTSTQVSMTDNARIEQEKSLTPFMRRVYAWTKRIPKGQVSTYGDIAKAMGDPQCSRAVGSALKKNPFAPMVPCHRVLKSDLDIGGFFGATSSTSARVQRKLQLLKDEGVPFVGTKVPKSKRNVVVTTFDNTRVTDVDISSTSLRAEIP